MARWMTTKMMLRAFGAVRTSEVTGMPKTMTRMETVRTGMSAVRTGSPGRKVARKNMMEATMQKSISVGSDRYNLPIATGAGGGWGVSYASPWIWHDWVLLLGL